MNDNVAETKDRGLYAHMVIEHSITNLGASPAKISDDTSDDTLPESPTVEVNNWCNVFFPESGREGFFRQKRCHSTLPSNIAQSSAEVMAVIKDWHQRLPKVLPK